MRTNAQIRLSTLVSIATKARLTAALTASLCLLAFANVHAAPPISSQLTNQLTNHASPYLALHARDPVAWQEWNAAAVARARREGKLLFISIGYFSCHWCHVMQRESYRNAAIARLLNKHFIPVKVDRELEPALDARMIDFVQDTRGMAGWPLNVFVTPEGAPVFATLYAPPDEFRAILQRLESLWRTDRKRLRALAQAAVPQALGPGDERIDAARVAQYSDKLVDQALAQADILNGGFGEQSKFPSVPQLTFLLEQLARAKNAKLHEFMTLTLDHMAAYGLHDHIGGGFFRYTVDPGWKTPHFEKMLYDNALLAQLYLRAAQVLERPDYRQVAQRSLNFLLRDMRDRSGAFVASLSALDNRGVEGGYYLWSAAELKRALPGPAEQAYRLAWGMQDAPPFDAGYLPMTGLTPTAVAAQMKLPLARVDELLTLAQEKLTAARARRRLPRDDKLLAAWNGLALAAFARAALETQDVRYRNSAREIKDYLATVLWDGSSLRRAVTGKRALGEAGLEDYAFVAEGLWRYAQLTHAEADFRLAAKIAAVGWQKFYRNGWRLSEQTLIAAAPTQDVIPDGPLPSPAATLMRVSLALAQRLDDAPTRTQALRALNAGHAQLGEDPFWHATHVLTLGESLRAR